MKKVERFVPMWMLKAEVNSHDVLMLRLSLVDK